MAQASLTQAQAQVHAAEQSLTMANQIYHDRTQSLAQINSASVALNQATINVHSVKLQTQSQVNSASAAIKQAKVNVNSAASTLTLQLKNDEIISPIAGTVVAISAQTGQSVQPQIPILTVETTTPVMATLNVPESDIQHLFVGMPMQITLPALMKSYQGQVLDIRPQTNPSTNEYQVDVKVNTANPKILSGMEVQASLHFTTDQKGIFVPAQSVVLLSDGGNEVFLVKNGVAQSRFVEIGAMTASQYQITSGLKTGDVLVTAGQNYLTNGEKVQIVNDKSRHVKGTGVTHS